MPTFPGFINGSAPSESVIATSERTVNWYVERVGTEGPQHKTALYPTPGQSPWITAASSRGVLVDINASAGIVAAERAFVVIGAGLYEVFADATIMRRATVTPGLAPAQLAFNGLSGGQLLVASGGHADCYTLATNTLTRVLTNEATAIGMLDGYFLALNATTGKLRLSNLLDGLTWDPTQFAFRSAQPDRWIGLLVNAPDLWLLGQHTGDVWFDAGTAPFPLAMRQGLTVQYGIVAPASLQGIGGQVFWLTSTREGAGLVVRSNGYDPQPVSTPEVASAIAGYQRTASIRDAEALVYRMAGHTFYVLRFPSANATWQYDLTTGIWTELGSWNPARGAYDVWRPRLHLYAFERHLVGEAQTGTLSLLDVTYATESTGASIRRLRRGPVLRQDLQRLPLRRFELVLEAGLGSLPAMGTDDRYAGLVRADGASHYWRLNEPSGTSAADSVGGAPGTISGGVTLNQPGALADGDTAMTFDGTTGSLTTTPITIGVTATIEGWIKTTTREATPRYWLSTGTPGSSGSLTRASTFLQGGRVIAMVESTAAIQGHTEVGDGQWHHLVVVLSGLPSNRMDLYVDGQWENRVIGLPGSPSVGALDLGRDAGFASHWSGSLDEVAIYPVALTPAQIAAHYTAGTTAVPREPVVLAHFSADGGQTWGAWRQCGAGRLGAYRTRAAFTRLGSPRLFVAEIVVSDPIPWRVLDALINNDATVDGRAA